ncbi:MAG: sarcosine oxidase subunit gamma [Rhizobiaceae bacterium]
MVEQLSPLGSVWKPGSHGNVSRGAGVTISEIRPGSIVEAAAWHGSEKKLIATIAKVTGLKLPDGAGGGVFKNGRGAFGIAPMRFLLVDQAEGLAERLSAAAPVDIGSVVDLSHGRTAIRISGLKAEWVLSKFFAIDFSETAFPLGSGKATVHHDFFTQIQRTAPQAFDLYVFRSFARSFWQLLAHGAEDVGYEVF